MASNKTKSSLPFGPALLVTAAFIGPGTLMTASKAGASYGYTLLWAVVASVVAAIILQEMAARLGIVTGGGLSRAIRDNFHSVATRRTILALVLVAILFGNAAYQTGNILGAAAGLSVLTSVHINYWILAIGAIAMIVVLIGRFDVLQILLTILVALMSVLFIVSAVMANPDYSAVAKGVLPTTGPEGDANWIWLVVALIGTTVVPYNLFLHANSAATRWGNKDESSRKDSDGEEARETRTAIRSSMIDTIVSVTLGGIITAAIIVTAAVAFSGKEVKLEKIVDVANQLRPALGASAEFLFATGLLAAGLTSAITAPIAAAYATAGCFGWGSKLSDIRLKAVAWLVIIVGVGFGLAFQASPKEAIIAAQVANGLLLPIIAVVLLIAVNKTSIMGAFRNRWAANVLGVIVIAVATLLAAGQFKSVIFKLFG